MDPRHSADEMPGIYVTKQEKIAEHKLDCQRDRKNSTIVESDPLSERNKIIAQDYVLLK